MKNLIDKLEKSLYNVFILGVIAPTCLLYTLIVGRVIWEYACWMLWGEVPFTTFGGEDGSI